MQSIVVRDNGEGIPYADVPTVFAHLGGSWKARSGRSKKRSRMLHGKDGKGRFKALALGRVADWTVTCNDGEALGRYTISLIRDNLVDVRVSELSKAKGSTTGVEVRVTELLRDFRSLEDDAALQELSEIFALYVSDYPDVSISYQGIKLDPSASIASRETIALEPVDEDGQLFPVELEVIEWKAATDRVVYLCNQGGFPLQRLTPRFHTPGFQFSAYIKSGYITELQKKGVLDLAEMNPTLARVYEEAQERIKDHFRQREAQSARSEIEQWKAESLSVSGRASNCRRGG